MPNGVDKNWVRLCAAIDGFRVRYNAWPSRILLPSDYIVDIQSLFSPELFQKLNSKIALVVDEEASIIAKDDGDRLYNYGQQGFCKQRPDIPAQKWLGVEPDIF